MTSNRVTEKKDWSATIVVVLLALNLLAVVLVNFFDKPSVIQDDSKYVWKIDSLKSEIDSTKKEVLKLEEQKKVLLSKVDSLEDRKVVIRKVYTDKYKQIDSSNVDELVLEFNKILGKNGK